MDTLLPVAINDIHSVEQNLAERLAFLKRAAGSIFEEDAEYIWLRSRLAVHNLVFKLTMRARFSDPERAIQHIDRIQSEYRGLGHPAHWIVDPYSRPYNLGGYLEAYGFRHSYTATAMTLDLSHMNEEVPALAGFDFIRVDTPALLRSYMAVLCQNGEDSETACWSWNDFEAELGLDGSAQQQHYLGLLNGKPLATGLVFYGQETAGLYHIATLPEARGKGIATQITVKTMQAARDSGYQQGVLISSQMGKNVYQRVGFKIAGKFEGYTWADR